MALKQPTAPATWEQAIVVMPKMIWHYKDEALCVSYFRNNPLQNYIMSKGKAARFGNKMGRAWTANIVKRQQLCGVAAHLKTEQEENVGTWCVTL
jgi:hypothetical protein